MRLSIHGRLGDALTASLKDKRLKRAIGFSMKNTAAWLAKFFQKLRQPGSQANTEVFPCFYNITNRNCCTKSDVTMNKPNIDPSIPAVAKSKASGNTLVAVLCLTFFPLVFVIGKMAASLLGN
jgi:hypothetical protein